MKQHNVTEVFWDKLEHPIFQEKPLYLAATTQGLCRITWPSESFDVLTAWVSKQLPQAILRQDSEFMSPYLLQVQEYLAAERQVFTLPLDLRGTAFQTSVWQALTRIPYGETRSYSEIAGAVGSPAAVRAVGTANGANPVPIVVPCHRVIGKNSALTGFRGGLQVKEELLRLEGFHDYTRKGHARFQF